MATKRSVDRRNFLKSAAVTGAAALTAGSGSVGAQQPAPLAPAPATAVHRRAKPIRRWTSRC